jgi:hypothetical protein
VLSSIIIMPSRRQPFRSSLSQHMLRTRSMQSEAACVPEFCAASIASALASMSPSGDGSPLQRSLSELFRSKSIDCDNVVIVRDNAKVPMDDLVDAALEALFLASGESSSDCVAADADFFVQASSDFALSVWDLDAMISTNRWDGEEKQASFGTPLNRLSAPIKPPHDPSSHCSQRRKSTTSNSSNQPTGIKQLQEEQYATTRRSVRSTTLTTSMPSHLRSLPTSSTTATSNGSSRSPRATAKRRALLSDVLEESIAISKSSFHSSSISGSSHYPLSPSSKSPSKQTRHVDAKMLGSNCRKMNLVF